MSIFCSYARAMTRGYINQDGTLPGRRNTGVDDAPGHPTCGFCSLPLEGEEKKKAIESGRRPIWCRACYDP